tara:strand:- start:2618 stop:3568 length:951 start_codon:yes stop_codon:yes gene_type:complete
MKKISTKNMTYERWLSERKHSIGASEAGSVLGLNPYQTAVDVYLSKVGQGIPVDDNLAMWLGRKMEPVIRERFELETGLKVRNDNKIRIDDEHNFLTTNLDGMVVGEKVPVEYKLLSRWDGEIPNYYFAQIQHQMMITDTPYIYFVVLLVGFQKQIIIEKYERNEDFINTMREQEVEFWVKYVVNNKPPAPTTYNDTINIHSKSIEGSVVNISVEEDRFVFDWVNQLMDLQRTKRTNEGLIKGTKQALMNYMGANESLQFGDSELVNWSNTKSRSKFNTAAFKKENPELYEKYCTESPGSRRFLLKAKAKLLNQGE